MLFLREKKICKKRISNFFEKFFKETFDLFLPAHNKQLFYGKVGQLFNSELQSYLEHAFYS